MIQQENEQIPNGTEDQKEISIESSYDFICIDPIDSIEYARQDKICGIDFDDDSARQYSDDDSARQYSDDDHPNPPISKGDDPNQCLYIDHIFDIDSGCLKVKSKADDEYYVVNSGDTPTGDVQKYFDSINYNNVVNDKINVNDLNFGDIMEFINNGKESYFLVNINGEKHIVSNDIIPSIFRNIIYEHQIFS